MERNSITPVLLPSSFEREKMRELIVSDPKAELLKDWEAIEREKDESNF